MNHRYVYSRPRRVKRVVIPARVAHWVLCCGLQNQEIKNRGYTFLIPIGRTWTQHEEKNDVSSKRDDRSVPPSNGNPQADDASEGSDGSERTGDANSLMDEDENESSEEEEEDLDADMEDLDRTGDVTADLDAEEMASSSVASSEVEDSD